MRTTRFINAGLGVALVTGAIAGPAAAVPALDDGPGNGASAARERRRTCTATRVRSLSRRPGPCTHSRSPRSPRWTTAGRSPSRRPGRYIPRSSRRPRPRRPRAATLVAHHSASSFDWGAAAIGAATTLAVLAIVLAAAVAIRRWRVGPPRASDLTTNCPSRREPFAPGTGVRRRSRRHARSPLPCRSRPPADCRSAAGLRPSRRRHDAPEPAT